MDRKEIATMESRRNYRVRMEARFDAWNAQTNRLLDLLRRGTADGKLPDSRPLRSLVRRHGVVRERIRRLEPDTGPEWMDATAALETAWQQMQGAWDRVVEGLVHDEQSVA